MEEQSILRPLSAFKVDRLEQAAKKFADHLEERDREYLQGRGLSEKIVAGSGLGSVPADDPEWGYYTGHISIPYRNRDGVTVGIRFRNVWAGDSRPKYTQQAGEATLPYGLPTLGWDSRSVVITEGEIDALTLHQLGIPAIAIPGVNNWKSHYRYLLDGYERIVVWGDPDEAGRAFNNHLLKAISGSTAAHLSDDINAVYAREGMIPVIDAFQRAGGVL